MSYTVYDRFLNSIIDKSNVDNNRIFSQLEESSKVEISDKLISELYKLAVDKSNSVDLGGLRDSKKAITRLKHYKTLSKSLELVTKLNPNNDKVKIVNDTIQLLKSYTKEFCLCFMQDRKIGIVVYNNLVLSVISGVSFLLNTSVDYLRTPNLSMDNANAFKLKYDRQDLILFTNMKKMVESANKGELKKFFNGILSKDNFIGSITAAGITISGGVLLGAGILAACILIIPAIRELVYFFYDFRMNVSEYFRMQAQFLETNIDELSNSSIKNKSEIIKKEEKRIATLNKIANKFEVNFNTADGKARKELSKKVDSEKLKSTIGDNVTLI